MGVSVGVEVPCRRCTFMNRKIHEDNYESKARASPRGEVRRKPATVRRGEEHERHRRLTSLGRGGTTQQRPVNRGSGYMSRRCGETGSHFTILPAPPGADSHAVVVRRLRRATS